MQNIYGKETELGNAMVYGTVREGAVFLEPADILPEFLPGDIFRLPAQNRLQIIQPKRSKQQMAYAPADSGCDSSNECYGNGAAQTGSYSGDRL